LLELLATVDPHGNISFRLEFWCYCDQLVGVSLIL
jgi:hypothetical protein